MRKFLNEPERHLKLLVLFFNFSLIFIDGGTADDLNYQVVFVWFSFFLNLGNSPDDTVMWMHKGLDGIAFFNPVKVRKENQFSPC